MAMKLRIWWIPQVPMEPFLVDVDSVGEGVKIMHTLADYDAFQFEKHVKPDFANAGGLAMFDPDDKTDSQDGSWTDWYDEETGDDNPAFWLERQLDQA